jgi:hypothetical protein
MKRIKSFSLDSEVVSMLEREVPCSERSRFVNRLLVHVLSAKKRRRSRTKTAPNAPTTATDSSIQSLYDKRGDTREKQS